MTPCRPRANDSQPALATLTPRELEILAGRITAAGYAGGGWLARKSGLTDFREWTAGFGTEHTPWGDEDSPAPVTAVETAHECVFSAELMPGSEQPRFATLTPGDTLTRQGDTGDDLYLVLDGVVRVDRDGEQLAEHGPGAILGERAYLEGGVRTSSLVAVTSCRVAAVPGGQFDTGALAELASGHRREEAIQGG